METVEILRKAEKGAELVVPVLAGAAAGCATVMIPDITEPNEELKNLTAGIYDSLMEAKEAIIRGEI